uniref:Heat shock protein 70 n=2 Tax=Palpitomonas bilix TaxID=652834 RepID=A0A7S3LUR7_9EUKA
MGGKKGKSDEKEVEKVEKQQNDKKEEEEKRDGDKKEEGKKESGMSSFLSSASTVSLTVAAAVLIGLMYMAGRVSRHETVLGIDLGTTFSVAAVCFDGDSTVIERNGRSITPSTIHLDKALLDRGQLSAEIGNDLRASDANVVGLFDIKRVIGRKANDPILKEEQASLPFEVVADGRGDAAVRVSTHTRMWTIPCSSLSGLVLSELKRAAEDAINFDPLSFKPLLLSIEDYTGIKIPIDPVLNAVRTVLGGRFFYSLSLSVPARFDAAQKKATIEAAERAGFALVKLVPEPVAAALAYGLEDISDSTILVFDFGGGTLDVAVLYVQAKRDGASERDRGGRFQVMGVTGDNHLGGEDIDRNTAHWMAEEAKKMGVKLDVTDPFVMKKAEMLKIELSANASATTGVCQRGLKKCTELTLTRDTFNAINSAIWQKAITAVDLALEDAMVEKEKVEHIILVGGSSRVPKIREELAEKFPGVPMPTSIDPDLAIGVGVSRAHC